MDFIMENPQIAGVAALVIVLILIVVISLIVSKKRKREVAELEQMFPEGSLGSEDMKISVEQVRRSTLRREKMKKKQQYIPRERPTEPLPDEDKEIIVRDSQVLSKQSKPDRKREDRAEKEKVERSRSSRLSSVSKSASKEKSEEQPKLDKLYEQVEDKEKSFAIRTKTRKANHEEETEKLESPKKKKPMAPQKADSEQKGDSLENRRLYKRSLLKPDRGRESKDLGKATLIDTQMFTTDEIAAAMDEKEKSSSRSKQESGKKWFSK
ncbi:hypothetical protein [Thermoactinomyces sp. CICC 10521]|jgi:hypothetical protein|uniref:hypothetical protein n=1 Tax=Thermoactinomyces sp. CICC 10521 TaxID=2767426 RepID=UPI0018DDD9B0|nr:hypothetical protein [Thermoactinomyces sp. CICC 10521]MBH8608664.1 hypothetical protein [Thermoactinomyces sp. CICC 10521]